MFHDRKLQSQTEALAEDQLFWTVNADAAKLLGMLRYYRKTGQTILPVNHLKRMGFTRRRWELATKGTRERVGSKLVDEKPAKDGLEYYGLTSEVTLAQDGAAPKTFWIMGSPSIEAIEECSQELDEAIERANRAKQKELHCDAIDADPTEEQAATHSPVAIADEKQNAIEDAYNQGAAEQHPRSFEKGRVFERSAWLKKLQDAPQEIIAAMECIGSLPRCSKTASLNNNIRDALSEHCEIEQRRASEAHLGF